MKIRVDRMFGCPGRLDADANVGSTTSDDKQTSGRFRRPSRTPDHLPLPIRLFAPPVCPAHPLLPVRRDRAVHLRTALGTLRLLESVCPCVRTSRRLDDGREFGADIQICQPWNPMTLVEYENVASVAISGACNLRECMMKASCRSCS